MKQCTWHVPKVGTSNTSKLPFLEAGNLKKEYATLLFISSLAQPMLFDPALKGSLRMEQEKQLKRGQTIAPFFHARGLLWGRLPAKPMEANWLHWLLWDSHALSSCFVAPGLGFEVCYWQLFQWRQCSSTLVGLSLLLPDSSTLWRGKGRAWQIFGHGHNNPFLIFLLHPACASCLYNLHWLSKVIFSNSGRIFSGRPTRTVFTSCRQTERKSISLKSEVRTAALQIWPVGEMHPRDSILGQPGLGSQAQLKIKRKNSK